MKILVINPNDSNDMRLLIEQSCREVAGQSTDITVVCAGAGVASVEGYYDGAIAQVGVLEQIQLGEKEGFDAYLIACADDTGLYAAREIAKGPVIGIGEAAMHYASMLGYGFAILTAQSKSIAILSQNAINYGFERQCKGVYAACIPVLALEALSESERAHLVARAEAILQHSEAEVLVFGCAGLTQQQSHFSHKLNLPVVDGVRAGVSMLEGLVRNKLQTSKRNTFQTNTMA